MLAESGMGGHTCVPSLKDWQFLQSGLYVWLDVNQMADLSRRAGSLGKNLWREGLGLCRCWVIPEDTNPDKTAITHVGHLAT